MMIRTLAELAVNVLRMPRAWWRFGRTPRERCRVWAATSAMSRRFGHPKTIEMMQHCRAQAMIHGLGVDGFYALYMHACRMAADVLDFYTALVSVLYHAELWEVEAAAIETIESHAIHGKAKEGVQ